MKRKRDPCKFQYQFYKYVAHLFEGTFSFSTSIKHYNQAPFSNLPYNREFKILT